VIVYKKEGKTVVSAFNPAAITSLSDNKKMHELSVELNALMNKVIDSL
jgi:hypothetical protein